MNTTRVVLATVLAGGISIGTAIIGQRWLSKSPHELALAERGVAEINRLPEFRLPDLSGREVPSSDWAGKILVVNYWASWCPPCVREMPMFIRAQEALRDNGVQFVGIALDRVQDVENFLIDHPVNYPILIGNTEAVALSKQLGNRIEGLPFTVIFDRQGRRVFSRIGEVTSEDLKTQIDALTETGDWQQSRS